MTLHRYRRVIRLVARVSLALLIGLLWFKSTRLFILAIDLNTRVKALKQEALGLRDSKDIPASIRQLRADLEDIHARLGDLRATLWPLEQPLEQLGWLPVIGRDVAAAPRLIEMVDLSLDASHHLDLAYGPWIEQVMASGQGKQGIMDLAVAGAQQGGQELDQARADVVAAQRARQAISAPEMLDPRLQGLLQNADLVLEVLDKGTAGAQAAPLLLGVDKPQHVLVLIENADELRATGGFITASAYVVVDHGQLSKPIVLPSNSPQIDSSALQYEQPPPPFYKYMHLINWYFRDANWWPDFPTSAEKAAGLYSAGTGAPVDTVVAINQYTVRDLLAATGPITTSDGTVIDENNAITAIQELWTTAVQTQGAEARKNFIQDLVPLVMQKLLHVGNADTLLKLWQANQTITQHHDLLLFSRDLPIQALAERLGWDGSIPLDKGDYAYLFDTNVGWNKVDLILQRAMQYHVNLTDPMNPEAELQMTYHHPGTGKFDGPACLSGRREPITYAQRADDCYADFLRLYLPGDTRLASSPTFKYPPSYVGLPDEDASHFIALPGERDKAVFGALMVLRPGRQTVLTFAYSLAPREIFTASADGGVTYSLTLPKQPGRQSFPVSVVVDLPEGMAVTRVVPPPGSQEGRTLHFELSADSDIHIQIEFSAAAQIISRLGIVPGAQPEAIPAPPRVVPTDPPLPTVVPVTPTPTALPTLPTPTLSATPAG